MKIFLYAARRGQNHVYLLACDRQIFTVYTHHHHHHHGLLCMYISRPRLCVFRTVRTLNVLLYCGSGPRKNFDEERHDSHDKMRLSDVSRLSAVHNKLVALVKTLCAE